MSLEYLKGSIKFVIILSICSVKYIHGDEGDESKMLGRDQCVAAIIKFRVRGNGLTLFPMMWDKCDKSTNSHRHLLKIKRANLNDAMRRKRSYRRIIKKLLGEYYPNVIGGIHRGKLKNDNEIEGETDVNKKSVEENKSVEELKNTKIECNDITIAPLCNIDVEEEDLNTEPYYRIKPEMKSLSMACYAKHKNAEGNLNRESCCKSNTMSCPNISQIKDEKDVLIIRIPKSLGELPIHVIKDDNSHAISIELEQSKKKNVVQNTDEDDEEEDDDDEYQKNNNEENDKNNENSSLYINFNDSPFENRSCLDVINYYPFSSSDIQDQNLWNRQIALRKVNKKINKNWYPNKITNVPRRNEEWINRAKYNPLRSLYQPRYKNEMKLLTHSNPKLKNKLLNNYVISSNYRPFTITQDTLNELIIKEIHKILDSKQINHSD